MHRPDHFRVEDIAQMHGLMRARPFAALVSSTSAGLYGTHLPTVLKDDGANGTIECHLARANPHWKDLVLFHEYFHGDNGRGLGASHQTGWTALVTRLLEMAPTGGLARATSFSRRHPPAARP